MMNDGRAKKRFICDVCAQKFRAEIADDTEMTCPRCRSPFVRPVSQRFASWGHRAGKKQIAPRYIGCG
jgi:hypothetical protein